MRVGKVIGNVWATKKDEGLEGFKLLVIDQINPRTKEHDKTIVAVDAVGAGPGEMVLIVGGSTARFAANQHAPTDATVVGIIDTLEIYEENE